MHDFFQDVRFALRMLRKAKAFTVAALVVLALGIGATSAIFSVVNAVVLRPLPYPDSDRVAVLHSDFRAQGLDEMPYSIPEFHDLRSQNRSFEALAAYQMRDANLGGVEPPERLLVAAVSPSFFPVLRVEAAPGRTFTPDEEKLGNDRVVLLSHALWQRRFGGDSGLVGRSIQLNGNPHTVVGVLPRGFALPSKADLWIPLAPTALDASEERRNWRNHEIIGRLKPGVTLAQAHEDLGAIYRRMFGEERSESTAPRVRVRTLKDFTVGETGTTLLFLLGAVAFVLLIACANVANLLLARTAARGREIAVRAALGAGSGRIAVQFLIESAVLALLGGALGLLLALWGVDALVAIDPDRLPRAEEIQLDGVVVAFTLGVSLLTGVVFGVIPALHAGRVDPAEVLKEGSRGTAGGRMGRFRNALVVAQIALALVLLAGAGLMTRSLAAMTRAPLGFDPQGVLTAKLALMGPRYEDPKARAAFFRDLLDRVRHLPGVSAAGVTTGLPISRRNTQSFAVEGRPLAPNQRLPYAIRREVSPGYFEAMRVPLISGRLFNEQDTEGAPLVAVVNQALVAAYFPDGNAIGARIGRPCGDPEECPQMTIVGVVGNVREVEVEDTLAPAFYAPYAQTAWMNVAIAIRTSQDPTALISALRSEIRAVDREQPIYEALPMQVLVEQRLGPRRFALEILGIFALTALVLAAVGLYGVTAFAVAQREREFGIRLALGAEARDILGMVLRKSLVLTGIGIGAGLVASLALSRVMASVLYGVSERDPLTLAIACPVLAGAALLASFFPARRATRVPPAIALRAE
ncbi:ABC transporter permease [Polyangium aurulentum]|uniref:ABC transporter permease n=1 Tax=Polyangium aurulentum TaxID=2567896 RepID=UPI0010AE6C49|nr:ABC transporter permease [Polyangium aurulentum]UQA57147.1 ABC transporter permease [Polyangium aurulentum]